MLDRLELHLTQRGCAARLGPSRRIALGLGPRILKPVPSARRTYVRRAHGLRDGVRGGGKHSEERAPGPRPAENPPAEAGRAGGDLRPGARAGRRALCSRCRAQEGSDEPEPPPPADRTEGLRSWERALKWSTAGALVATSALGTMAAMNQPTAFGDGQCLTGHAVLGTYGCDRGLSTLHGTAASCRPPSTPQNGVLAFAIPGPEGNVSESERPWHRTLTYVHLGGMILQPLLGLISAYPRWSARVTPPPSTHSQGTCAPLTSAWATSRWLRSWPRSPSSNELSRSLPRWLRAHPASRSRRRDRRAARRRSIRDRLELWPRPHRSLPSRWHARRPSSAPADKRP